MTDLKKRLRIGVTISNRGGNQSIWENGISQNCVFLVLLLRKLEIVSEAVLVTAGNPASASEGMMIGTTGIRLIGLEEAMAGLDVIVEMGAQLTDEWAAAYRKKGGRYVGMRVGNDYVIDVERTIFDQPHGSLMTSKTYDALWTIPGHERSCSDYFSITSRQRVTVVPHLWSPLFFQRGIDSLLPDITYGYRAGSPRWRICCFEPNINLVKTSMLPMLIGEEAYREDPRMVEFLRFTNTYHLVEQPFFKQFANSLDIVTHGLATFEARFHVYDFLARYGDCVVCHQWACPQNYLYYEVLYGKYPLIHNSELLRGHGYYYPDFDCQEGGRALVEAFRTHDQNLERYSESCEDLLRSVSIDNPANLAAYTRELLALYGADTAAELNPPRNQPDGHDLGVRVKESPSTALICVTRNNWELLEVTLNSILERTTPGTYDLFIIDNASTDATNGLYGRSLGDHVTVIRNNRNLNWVKGINQGLELTRNYRYVGFLNNDIEVSDGWLERMVSVLDADPEVGAVGPVSSNPRDWQNYDRVREFFPGMDFPELAGTDRSDAAAMAEGIAGNPESIIVGGMLAFFCTILRRSVIDAIGYLDEDFNDLFLGDDDEYCHRLQQAGYRLSLCANAYVAHHSGSSSLQIPGFEERQRKAIEVLKAKNCLR